MSYKAIGLILFGVVVGAIGNAALTPMVTSEMTLHAAASPEQQRASSSSKKYVRLTTPRIPAVDAASMTPEQKAIGGNANIASVLNNPPLAKRWWDWLTFVYDNGNARGDGGVNAMDKEILLLRTAWLNHDDWLWGMHAPMAKGYGHTDEELARIPKGASAPGWSDKDKALIAAADELHADSFISDETWKKLTSYYNSKQMLDIIFVVGTYTTNAYYANSVGLPYATGRATGLPAGH